jgi:hypothetical protein
MTTATQPAPTRLEQFASMSAVLTGFTMDVISPMLDPKDLKTLYLKTADAKLPPGTVDTLLSRFKALAGKAPQEIADTLLQVTDPTPDSIAAAAQSIVKLWYVGVWYPPPAEAPTVVSADAYTGGLLWKAIQAHPIGFSTFTFGYWNSEPPSMQAFGVDDAPSGGSSDV